MHQLFKEIDKYKKGIKKHSDDINSEGKTKYVYDIWEEKYTNIKHIGVKIDYKYKEFDEIIKEFKSFINTDSTKWKLDEINNLLYLIEQDKIFISILDKNSSLQNTNIIKVLAENGLKYNSFNVKISIIKIIHKIYHLKTIEKLIIDYIKQNDDIIFRISLITLYKIQSNLTEKYCEIAWNSNNEDNKILALSILDKINSNLLENYIKLSKEDGRKNILKKALQIEAKNIFLKPLFTILIKVIILIIFLKILHLIYLL